MKYPTADEWSELISKFEQSELTQKEFAAKHDIHLSTFQYWLYRTRRSGPRTLGIVSKSSPKFLPVQVVASPAPEARVVKGMLVEVELRGGPIVRFAIGSDTRYLAELCAALG